jgi:hypothetical protein
MASRAMPLVAAALAVITAAIAPSGASARTRTVVTRVIHLDRGLAPWDFCGGRLPSFGSDACGYRELSYGPNTCWRRLPYRPYGPQPRRVYICG